MFIYLFTLGHQPIYLCLLTYLIIKYILMEAYLDTSKTLALVEKKFIYIYIYIYIYIMDLWK